MSRSSPISEIFGELDLNKIPKKIALYEDMILAAESILDLAEVKLEVACKDHAKNKMVYNLLFKECQTIEEAIKIKVESIESSLYKALNENNDRALGNRDINQYIKSDKRYLEANEILLEVMLVRKKLEAVVDAIESFGWSLNNIVKLRIAQLENVVL